MLTKRKTKKATLLILMEQNHRQLDLSNAAEILYNNNDEWSKQKVIRLLAAYRIKDKRFKKIRVRHGKIVETI